MQTKIDFTKQKLPPPPLYVRCTCVVGSPLLTYISVLRPLSVKEILLYYVNSVPPVTRLSRLRVL